MMSGVRVCGVRGGRRLVIFNARQQTRAARASFVRRLARAALHPASVARGQRARRKQPGQHHQRQQHNRSSARDAGDN